MKYLIINYQDMPTPILFPDHVPHSFLSDTFQRELGNGKIRYETFSVISAGFVFQINSRIRTYGESETLGLRSHPEDAKLIQAMFGDWDDVFEVIPKMEGVKV